MTDDPMASNNGRKVSHLGKLMAKQKTANAPWLRNAVKSIGLSYRDVFKDITPTMYDIGSTSAKTLSDLTKTVRSTSQAGLAKNLSNNQLVKIGKAAINNSIKDLKEGKFYNAERQSATGNIGFGLDDFDFNLDDEGTFFDDWGENADVQINNVNAGGSEIAYAVGDQIGRAGIAQLKGQKAQIDSMIALTSASMSQIQTLGNNVLTELGNISSGISALVEFNNSTMSGFIEKATGYMEKMGAASEPEYDTSDKIQATDLFNSKGRFSASNYKKYAMQRITSFAKNSTAGSLASMLIDSADMMLANPLGALTTIALKQMTPKAIKEFMSSFDEALSGFIPTILHRISDWADDYSFGPGSMIKRAIGSTLGIKNKRKAEWDMDEKINSKPVPFDKATRHAIIEIIPKYLSEQVALTKELVRVMGGNQSAINKAERFDLYEGKYNTVDKIRKNVYGRIRDTTINEMRNSRFGSALVDRNPRYLQNTKASEADANRYNDILNEFFVQLEKYGKSVNINDQTEGSALDTVLRSTGYSDKELNYLRAAIRDVAKDKKMSQFVSPAVINATGARNRLIESMQNDPDMYGLYQIDLTKNIDEGIGEVFKTTFGDTEKIKKVGTMGDILNDIRFILDRGINVRINAGLPYKSIGDATTSNVERSSVPKGRKRRKRRKDTNVNPEDQALLIGSDHSDAESAVSYYDEIFNKEAANALTTKEKGEITKGHMLDAMNAFAFGSSQQAFNELAKILGDQVASVGETINNKFLTPLKESIFGKKDERGYSRDGLFSGIQNKFMDTYKSFMRDFDGRAYIDSKGKLVKAKEDGEPTVLGNIKNAVNEVKTSFMDYVFGEKDTKTGKRKLKEGNIIGKMVNTLQEGFEGWKEAIFGKQTDEEKQKTLTDLKESVKKTLPAAVTGGIGGAAFGALSGGSILGTLIGGPIGGAVLGGIGGILSQSDKFKDYLFGKIDEKTKERTNGLISKQTQDFLSKNKKFIIGGAAFGAIKSAFSGGGILGTIVGGPMAGALLGAGAAMVAKSDFFQEFIFGKEGSWHKGLVPMFNGLFKKKGKTGEDEVSGARLAGMAGIGTLGGAMTAGLIGKMGLLGAMATPMGPIGGAIAGLALSIKASKGSFHEWLFGKDGKDGKHTAGILEKFGNMLDVELFTPLKHGLANFVDDTRNFIIDKMMAPIEFAVEPLVQAMINVKDRITSMVTGFLKMTGKFIKENVLDPIVGTVSKFIIRPFRMVFGTLFKAVTGVAKTAISTPFEALAVATNFMDYRQRRTSRKKVMRDNRRQYGLLGGMARNMKIRFHYGDEYEDASNAYNNYDTTDWRYRRNVLYREDRKKRLQEQRDARRNRRNLDWNRQKLSRILGYTVTEDNAENRAMAEALAGKEIGWREVKLPERLQSASNTGTGDKNVTTRSAVNSVDNPSADIQTRQFGLLTKLYRFITGQKTGGDDNLESPNPSPDDVKKQKTEESKQPESDKDALDLLNDALGGQLGNVKETLLDKSLNAINDMMFNGYNPLSIKQGYEDSDLQKGIGGLKNKLTKFADKLGIKKFADGGVTDGNISLTGENGPELAVFPKGTQILNGMKALPVVVQGYKKGVLETFADKVAGKVGTTIHDKVSELTPKVSRPSEAEKEYESIKKAGSYETLMAEKEKEETREFREKLLNNQNDSNTASKKHFNLWSTIFSKKGLITGGLLALSPLIFKFLKTDWGQKLTDVLSNAISKILHDLLNGPADNENNDTPGERIEENVSDVEELIETGDLYDYIFPDGHQDHMTGAKINVLAHIPAYAKRFGNWITKGKGTIPTIARGLGRGIKGGVNAVINKGSNIVKGIKTGINTALDVKDVINAYGGGAKGAKEAFGTFMSFKNNELVNGAKGAFQQTLETGGVTSRVGKEAAEGQAGKALAGNGETLTKTVAKKAKSAIDLVKSAITKLWELISEKLGSKGGKAGQTVVKYIDDFIAFVSKHSSKLASKLQPVLAKAGGLAATGVGLLANDIFMAGVGAVNGLTAAARLFQTDEPDTIMTIIASVIYGITNTTLGSIIDIVNEFSVDIMGFDFIHEFACVIYNIFASEEDYDKLMQGIQQNRENYNTSVTAEYQTQFNTYKQITGNENMTYEQFLEGVSSGQIDAYKQSYADYNDQQHQTLGSRITGGLNKYILKPGRDFIRDTGRAIFGYTEEKYVDVNGNVYAKNETRSGTYDVFDANGQTIGYISEDEFKKMKDAGSINTITTEHDNILTKAKNTAKDIGSSAVKFAGGLATNVVDAAKGFIKGRVWLITGFEKSDDVLDYFTTDIDTGIDDDNPLKGAVEGILNVMKVPAFINGWIGSIFKSVGSSAVNAFKTFIDNAKAIPEDISSNHSSMVNLANSGEFAKLLTYDSKSTAESGPLDWMVNAVGGVEKMFLTVPAGINSFGKNIKSFINGIKEVDAIGNLTRYVKSAWQYIDVDKDFKGLSKLKFGDDNTDDPVNTVVGGLAKKFMTTFVTIVRAVNEIGDKVFGWIGDGISNIKDVGGNIITSIKNFFGGNGSSTNKRGGRGSMINLPYFSQNDPRWGNMAYGDETMSEAGCGPNAMAMVASGLGGSTSPMAMADMAMAGGYRDETGTNWNFIDNSSKQLGLNAEKQYQPTPAFITSEIKKGRPVILSGQGGLGTPYTEGGHYVVATGTDSNGNVMISDPRGRSYSGKYPMSVVAGNANVGWGFSKSTGGRGNRRKIGKLVVKGGYGNDSDMLNGFPFLLQGDSRWGTYQYTSRNDKSQTISTSGCGVTAMAMVLRSYGNNISPIDTANYSLQNGFRTANSGTSWGFFGSIANKYSLTCKDLGKSATQASQYLDNGWPVIASMGPGTFTKSGHFIVLVGKDSNGNIVVNDPASLARSQAVYPLSVFKNEAKNFWAFAKNGKGSINHVIPAGSLPLSGSSGTTYTEVEPNEGSPLDALQTIGNILAEAAKKAWNGLLTGQWNYDFSSVLNQSTTSGNDYDTSISGYVGNGANTTVTTNIPGSTNQEKVWNYLRNKGLSEHGVAALMGNLYAESGIEPTNLQNTYEKSLGFSDSSYTKAVDSGSYGNFINDEAGYGLAQWTYKTRKAALLNAAKNSGKSIGDLGMQLDYLWDELNGGYKGVLDVLQNASDIQTASNYVLRHFENPKVQDDRVKATRASYGQNIYDRYRGSGVKEVKLNPYGVGGRGGGRGDSPKRYVKHKRYNPYTNTHNITNGHRIQSGFGNVNKAFYSRYTNYGGGRGPAGETTELLRAMIGILENIANATISSDQKLNLLRNISSTGNQINISGGNNTNPIIVAGGNGNNSISSVPRSRNESIAVQIAQGF